jgi:hypothetical protein
MTLVERTPYPYKIFSNVDHAIQWLAPRRNVPKERLVPAAGLIEWHGRLITQLSA